MLLRAVLCNNRKIALVLVGKSNLHTSSALATHWYGFDVAGNREMVGWGVNGHPGYIDRLDFPYPSIRFKVDDAEILKLREKEKGDWKLLTLEEKKKLYRSSFKATFAEILAPTGDWKMVLAIFLAIASMSMVFFGALKIYVMPPLPYTLNEDWREAQLQYMIDTRSEPITGIASKWDYEKNRWKK